METKYDDRSISEVTNLVRVFTANYPGTPRIGKDGAMILDSIKNGDFLIIGQELRQIQNGKDELIQFYPRNG